MSVTLSEMERFCLNEASRIEVIQAELVRVGDRAKPDPEKLREKEICEGLVRLIRKCQADRVIMDRLKAGGAP